MSKSRRKNNKQQSDVDTNNPAPVAKVEARVVYEKLGLYSILVPLVISLAFLVFEMIGLYTFSPHKISGEMILPMIISYFAPTLFSSSVFMILQQFFLLVPAGFEAKKGLYLIASAFLFGSSYSVYLAGKQNLLAQICIFFLMIFFFFVNLYSLNVGKRKLDNGSFSG